MSCPALRQGQSTESRAAASCGAEDAVEHGSIASVGIDLKSDRGMVSRPSRTASGGGLKATRMSSKSSTAVSLGVLSSTHAEGVASKQSSNELNPKWLPGGPLLDFAGSRSEPKRSPRRHLDMFRRHAGHRGPPPHRHLSTSTPAVANGLRNSSPQAGKPRPAPAHPKRRSEASSKQCPGTSTNCACATP